MKTENVKTPILLLRDQDGRIGGDGLTWWVYLDPTDFAGQPYVGATPLEPSEQRGWWRIPYGFDPENDVFEMEGKPRRRVVGYLRTRAVEGYPERMTPEEYHDTVYDDEDGEGDALARVLYEPEYEDIPPVRETVDATRVVLDGTPPPDDGLSWQPDLPAALRTRQEYAHLFPGVLLGFREAVASALNAIDGVQAHTRSGSPNVQVFLHVKLPRLERIEWQRTPFRPGMTRDERRKMSERLAQTHEVTTRSLEIPVVPSVEGATRRQATERWHDGIAELVSFVESILGRLCPTCEGRGFLEGDEIAEVERLREDVARSAADTTAAELRQRIEFVRTVLDRNAEINAAREYPEQQVYDLISEVRYQLEPRG